MEYFVAVYYNRPDVIMFETFNRVIKEELPKEFAGEFYESYGRLRWRNQLDLSDKSLGFFSMTKIDQLRVLEQFITDSLAVPLAISSEQEN